MGWWKLLTNLNNAEGTRESMRMAFDKGISRAGGDVKRGLFEALASRWKVGGVPINEMTETMIWVELTPFLHLPRNEARTAIAEYVVYKERPAEANIAWLTQVVQRGCRLAKQHLATDEYNGAVLFARDHKYAWTLLLDGKGNDYFWA